MKNDEPQTEEQIIDSLQNGEMTYVEYLRQYDEDVWDEYIQYCIDNDCDPDSEDSAHSFIDYREDQLDASMDD